MTSGAAPLDLVREFPQFFKAKKQPELIDLPEAAYLVVSGSGSPDGQAFQDAISALYSVAYSVRFASKAAGRDFKVPTFGGDWYFSGPAGELSRDEFRWELLMMMPGFVREEDVEKARQAAARKKGALPVVRLERRTQGLCVQVMHLGPYSAEAETLEKLSEFMTAEGLVRRGPHHEVCIGNPQRAKPDSLKTILRQPVERA